MLKKVIAVLCAVAMFATVITGCGKTEQNQGDNSTNQETVSQDEEKEIPKVYIFMNNGAAGGNVATDPAIQESVRQKIIAEAGVEPVLLAVGAGAEEEKLNALLASGENIDVFWGNWSDYSSRGAIIPINDLLEKYGKNITKEMNKDMFVGATDSEGNIWGIPRSQSTKGNPVYIRADWLKECGLEVPTTIAELENVLKVFKEKDLAGNGTTIPLVIKHGSMKKALYAAFTGVASGRYLDPADGKVKADVLHPEYKTLVETMAKWYELGYINKEAFSMSSAQIREYIAQGKVGVHAEWYSNVTLFTPNLQLNEPDADYVIANIVNENGVQAQTLSSPGQKSMLITKSCKNPEAVMKLIDWAYESIDNYILLEYGIEGETWKYTDETKTNVESITKDDQRVYCGDFNFALGIMENKMLELKSERSKHEEYVVNTLYDYSDVTKGFDFGVIYDSAVVNEEIPMKSDLDRMMEEEVIKFIIGSRSLTEWDAFIQELYGIGMDTYIEVYTRLYNEAK